MVRLHHILDMLSFLSSYYRNGIRRYLSRDRTARYFTLVGFLVVAGLLALLVYFGLVSGLRFIMSEEFFGEAVALYVIELFFLVAFLLMYVSAFIGGLVSLFSTSNVTLLLASPSFRMKAVSDGLRLFFASLWPLLVIMIPGLIAFVRIFSLPLWIASLALVASFLLVLIATVCALLTVYALALILVAFRSFSRLRLVISGILTFALVFTAVWSRFRGVHFVDFFQAKALDKAAPDLAPILAQFAPFPTHPLVSLLSFGAHGEYLAASIALTPLLIWLLVPAIALTYLLKRMLPVWQVAQEGHGGGNMHERHLGAMLAHSSGAQRALFMKELIVFTRNTRGLLWFFFVLSMWAIESGSGRLFTRGLGDDRVTGLDVPAFAVALQFALVMYFVAMIALRFVFPTFSEERKAFRVIRMSPLDLSRFFMSKLVFFGVPLSFLSASFTALHLVRLGVNGTILLVYVGSTAIGAFLLTTLALYLSARFPDNETDDPEMLSTTLPGLSFILLSLCFGAAGALSLYPLRSSTMIIPFACFILLTVVAGLLLVKKGKMAANGLYDE